MRGPAPLAPLSLASPALAVALALAAGPALAQDAGGCAEFKWPVARERSAFATPGLRTVEPGKPLPGIMDPAVVALQPVADVRFERPPSRAPRAGTFGAVLKTPPLAVGGVYQITVSDDAWIDVVQDGRELRPTGTTGAKGCPDVRKSVRFLFSAGQATVQISGAPASSIKVDFLPPEKL